MNGLWDQSFVSTGTQAPQSWVHKDQEGTNVCEALVKKTVFLKACIDFSFLHMALR